MNTQLVESLVQIVRSLTPEEQSLFEAKLKAKKHNWREQRQKIHALKAEIFARRGGEALSPSPEDLIRQGREERTAIHDEWIHEAFAGHQGY
jgi:hypothetical protein